MAVPKWWNWQTRYLEGVVGFRPCEFESRLRHHNSLARKIKKCTLEVAGGILWPYNPLSR